ncbi:TetR family transcriptional regulator [Mycobacterium europaeum]|uniref:TetR family transcriptional regulator n=1 Tax=Mycobacterium europaeum TaxID=761804 RepID=A0A0U1DHP9_9MYCO|nr:TetR/AcrR family transcriptional regulator [Mycobacterium europaeum]ORV61778.1 TetR family transcriptional regulator [Mycobacterium europaeum]CQD16807.1 TetR family transcriptional regulator [Mycobacterium europaeum]
MSRWEPNAAARLEVAAVELFADRGYDNVTVVEIAERAGLTKRTFFRHFADKREILFRGQDAYREMFAAAIASAPADATPMQAVGAALTGFAASFARDRREFLAKRQAVIASSLELKERDLLKAAALTAAMAEALVKRGVQPPIANLAAQVGALAYGDAFQRWLQPGNRTSMAKLAEKALRDQGSAIDALR